jgi:type II secretory pathway predicted ATPase ExeA
LFDSKGQEAVLGSTGEPKGGRPVHGRWAAALEAAFRETADSRSYVPRADTESILKQLESVAMQPDRPAGLRASPGMGKSILLRVLAERLAERRRCVFLPYGSLSLPDLCAWALGIMQEPRLEDPVEELLSIAESLRDEGSALVLLIDDASGMRLDEARQLGKLWARANGGLQLVLTSPDDARGHDVFAAVGHDLCTIRLRATMSSEETRHFVRARLELAGVPRVTQNRLDTECTEWIHLQSGGVPRLAQRLGHFLLVDQPADVTPSWRYNHDWLGMSLDEVTPLESTDPEDSR